MAFKSDSVCSYKYSGTQCAYALYTVKKHIIRYIMIKRTIVAFQQKISFYGL